MFNYFNIRKLFYPQLEPTWKMNEKFQTHIFQFVMRIDADISIRPMTHYVETIDEIKKNYDKIAYEKSSCVLRMFDNAIGKDKFKKAVDMYLQNKSFKNAEEDDLFKYLEEAFKIYGDNSVNITKAMKSWTNQRGFPIVFANVNYREGTIELSQQRFVDKFQKDLDDPIYFIPINYISSETERPKNHTAFTWFKNKTQTYQLPNEFSVNDWIVLNFEQTGYYRINYDNSTWSILVDLLHKNHEVLPTENRAQIVDDLFNLADNGYMKNYTSVLEILKYFKNEDQYSPWNVFDVNVGRLFSRLQDRKSFENFKKSVRKILVHQFNNVTTQNEWDNIPPTQRVARETIIRLSCKFELEECKKLSLDNNDVDLRKVRFCLDVKNGNSVTIENLFKMLETDTTKDEIYRNDIFMSFGCTSDINLLNQILNKVFEVKNTPYLTQDERKTIQQSIYQQSSLGVNTILEFWDSSPKLFVEVMGKDNVNDLIIDISNYCYTDRQQKKVKDAFRDSPKKSSIELNIEVNRKWANMHGNSIDSYYNSAFSFSINISLIAFVLFVLNRLV